MASAQNTQRMQSKSGVNLGASVAKITDSSKVSTKD